MGDVRPEYVFLGFLAESPAHGYQLYQQFKKDLSGLWHISESQMYASLKRLEKRGWIAPEEKSPAGADTDANVGRYGPYCFKCTYRGHKIGECRKGLRSDHR